MSIWSSIFGPRPGAANPIDIRPSGLLIDADGWFYEESLDSQCPLRTIRIQQDRPGDWYVRNTNCSIAELNDPARAAEVLAFFTGSFRWLKFEREAENGRGVCIDSRLRRAECRHGPRRSGRRPPVGSHPVHQTPRLGPAAEFLSSLRHPGRVG
jgi:hypothetical protein